MSISENAELFIDRVEYTGDFRLRLVFNDGVERVVDFGPFLRHSRNPLIQTYLDPVAFARFAVKDGDLIWDDYALCFPVADLYEGRV